MYIWDFDKRLKGEMHDSLISNHRNHSFFDLVRMLPMEVTVKLSSDG